MERWRRCLHVGYECRELCQAILVMCYDGECISGEIRRGDRRKREVTGPSRCCSRISIAFTLRLDNLCIQVWRWDYHLKSIYGSRQSQWPYTSETLRYSAIQFRHMSGLRLPTFNSNGCRWMIFSPPISPSLGRESPDFNGLNQSWMFIPNLGDKLRANLSLRSNAVFDYIVCSHSLTGFMYFVSMAVWHHTAQAWPLSMTTEANPVLFTHHSCSHSHRPPLF